MEQHLDYNDFLQTFLGEAYTITPLAGDASTREYFRVTHHEHSYILCADHFFLHVDPQAYPFLRIYNLLREHAVPVPEVYAHDTMQGLFLLQDVGDLHLENIYATQNKEEVVAHYTRVLELLVRIQGIRGSGDSLPFSLSFDVDKLMYEFDFFITHALKGYFKLGLSERDESGLRNMFAAIAELLYQPEYFVFTHRDFHSRNILYCADQYYVIDFQDARMGLPQYDLVSLLQDSYIHLPDSSVVALQHYYYHHSLEHRVHSMSEETFYYYYDLMAFQRNVKALGTFCYQVNEKKNRRYEPYITSTLRYLPHYAERRDVLAPVYEILSGFIGGQS